MRTVTPTFFNIATAGQVTPVYAIMALQPLLVLLMSSPAPRWGNLTIMPNLTPNPWMLANHADKGSEPWEIYAWCVRDAISKHAGIKTLDEKLTYLDKKAYVALMNGWKDKVEING